MNLDSVVLAKNFQEVALVNKSNFIVLCKRRRIKSTQKHTSMGMTTIEHITQGMCRQCAWERIKHKCKICDDIVGKGYSRLLAHITSHYTSNELLYNEDKGIDIISINFESPKTSLNEGVVGEEQGHYPLECKVCRDLCGKICVKERGRIFFFPNKQQPHHKLKHFHKKERSFCFQSSRFS
jgi:hypothetical protein